MPPQRRACSAPPDLHASTSLHRQRVSRAPFLHVATPTSSLQISDRDRAHEIGGATQRATFAETRVLSAMATDRNLSREAEREESAVIPFADVESATTPAAFDWAEQLMNDASYQ